MSAQLKLFDVGAPVRAPVVAELPLPAPRTPPAMWRRCDRCSHARFMHNGDASARCHAHGCKCAAFALDEKP